MEVWRGAVRRMLDSPSPRRYSEEDYELLSDRGSPSLPNHTRSESHHQPARRRPPPPGRARSLLLFFQKCCTLRRILTALFCIPVLLAIAVLWSGIPPDYADVRAYERRLPQHNLSLPFPEGKDGLYLRFPGHLWGHGLNNILQETILMSYLAYASNRSFVFEDYTWSHTPFPWTIYDFALRPKRIPLNAFISGPTAGGPFSFSSTPSSHSPPRAISAEWWETVCPKAKRHIISSHDAPTGWDVEGDEIIEWWVQKLAGVKDYGCIEVDSSERIIFDRYLFGSTRILSLWPALATSPILSAYTWSPLVQSGVSRNFALLQPLHPTKLFDLSAPSTLTGLVAVHLRRGDYSRHCPRLAEWGSTYMGLNQFPGLPDKFAPPSPSAHAPDGSSHPNDTWTDDGEAAHTQTTEEYYLAHCLPTIPQIVSKLHFLRLTHPSLRRVYVLSNGWPMWLSSLKSALQADGWDDLVSSVDVERNLDAEQGYVSMAVDMAIAEKAEVFVGNGFSSLSSNVVMLRMAKGLDESTNRFL